MNRLLLIVACLYILFSSGCALKRPVSPGMPGKVVARGPYHVVQKGETLWRICHNYGLPMEKVAQLNHIDDVSQIEVGQKIYLPSEEETSVSNLIASDRAPYHGSTERNFIWPARGRLCSFFGSSHDGWVNKGIEIKLNPGQKNIVSPKTGKIMFFCEEKMGYDNVVMIDHGDGFVSIVAGPGKFLSRVGEVVKQGEPIISIVGIKGPIVHYELRKKTKPVNPLKYLSGR